MRKIIYWMENLCISLLQTIVEFDKWYLIYPKVIFFKNLYFFMSHFSFTDVSSVGGAFLDGEWGGIFRELWLMEGALTPLLICFVCRSGIHACELSTRVLYIKGCNAEMAEVELKCSLCTWSTSDAQGKWQTPIFFFFFK